MIYEKYDGKDYTELKRLWKTAFHDSDDYIEYYFQNVVNRNMIYVAWDGKKLVAMVHLNPYTLVCKEKEISCHYIVGVATDPMYQRQGVMKNLLRNALAKLQNMGESFTYLMPAKEEYYVSLGFRNMEPGYIFSWQDYISMSNKSNVVSKQNWCLLPLDEVTDFQWKNFNRRLSEQYDLFVRRDAAYMADLKLQCQSMSGDVYIVSDQEKIIATMGVMYEEGYPECIQYITTENSILPMQYVDSQFENRHFIEIEIFGSWLKHKYPELQTKPGKGIMYKIFDKHFSNIISCDKMLMINEIV